MLRKRNSCGVARVQEIEHSPVSQDLRQSSPTAGGEKHCPNHHRDFLQLLTAKALLQRKSKQPHSRG